MSKGINIIYYSFIKSASAETFFAKIKLLKICYGLTVILNYFLSFLDGMLQGFYYITVVKLISSPKQTIILDYPFVILNIIKIKEEGSPYIWFYIARSKDDL